MHREPLEYRTTLRLPLSLAKKIKKEAKSEGLEPAVWIRVMLGGYFISLNKRIKLIENYIEN